MSGLSLAHRPESVNGTPKRSARKPQPSKQRGSRKAMKHARRLACAVGSVGVGVLSHLRWLGRPTPVVVLSSIFLLFRLLVSHL